MFTLIAMSSRRRSSRVSLTLISMTACGCFSLSKSATRSRSASHRRYLFGMLQLDAREFVQPVAEQSMHAHRIVRIWGERVLWVWHRDERVNAARGGEPLVPLGHVDAVDARNGRAALHTEQLHFRRVILADEQSQFTQRATDMSYFVGLHALAPRPLAAVAAQCHQPVGQLSVRPEFEGTHEQCVRVAHVTHTPHFRWRVVWGSVHVAQVAGVVAHSHRAHHSVVVIREEQLVARRVVAHSIDVRILISGCHKSLRQEAFWMIKEDSDKLLAICPIWFIALCPRDYSYLLLEIVII